MRTISSDAVHRFIRGSRPHVLFVDHGIVNCPRQGDTELDACLGCSDFKKLSHRQGLAVVCSPPASFGFDPTPFSWFKPFDAS